MLSKTDLNQSLDKKAYKETMEVLEKKLALLQQALWELKIPVVVVFEGWGASGKGTYIGRVVYPLDPRYFNVYTMDKVNEDMQMRPYLWSYWVNTPMAGRITIFDKSWHRIMLPAGCEKWRLKQAEINNFYNDVNAFEQQLTDSGALIIKLFLHIGQEEQRKRFRDLEKREDTAWRVDNSDWAQNEGYAQHLKDFEKMLKMTDTAENPWHIIEANDKKYATAKIYRTLIDRIETRIGAARFQKAAPAAETAADYEGVRILRQTPTDVTVEDEVYKKELDTYQKRMDILGHKLYAKRRSLVIVYEGWDAAGKGGNIKRLTEELDPRCYEVVPIGAPTPEELAHHYLWRFYRKLPKDGHIAIYDRSWYGRVLVERVEKLTPARDWRRAYTEINDMEANWSHHGIILLKFWLHIDREEQLARFKSRQDDPLKQYKITEEDWRNREKWDLYEDAVDEMLAETSKSHAPWTVVESNSKKYARLKVMRTVIDTLEEALR